jgi:hypothetical protein
MVLPMCTWSLPCGASGFRCRYSAVLDSVARPPFTLPIRTWQVGSPPRSLAQTPGTLTARHSCGADLGHTARQAQTGHSSLSEALGEFVGIRPIAADHNVNPVLSRNQIELFRQPTKYNRGVVQSSNVLTDISII